MNNLDYTSIDDYKKSRSYKWYCGWFEDNYKELYKKYKDKIIVVDINTHNVYGAYNTYREALREALYPFDLGEFQIYQCAPTFHEMNILNWINPF